MSEIKTKKTTASVAKFIAAVSDAQKREDTKTIVKMMSAITGEKPAMWGPSIIGFGTFRYKGRSSEGDWPITGLSPRKANLTVYLMLGFKEYGSLLKKLGPHKTSVSCLYIKRLSDIHLPTLETLIKRSVADMKKKYKL